VIDGEIVVLDAAGHRLDLHALQLRIHPPASQVELLSARTPAHFVAFDLLAQDDSDYLERPFAERRAALEDALAAGPRPRPRSDPTALGPAPGGRHRAPRLRACIQEQRSHLAGLHDVGAVALDQHQASLRRNAGWPQSLPAPATKLPNGCVGPRYGRQLG